MGLGSYIDVTIIKDFRPRIKNSISTFLGMYIFLDIINKRNCNVTKNLLLFEFFETNWNLESSEHFWSFNIKCNTVFIEKSEMNI